MLISINKEEQILDNSFILDENLDCISSTPIIENDRLQCYIASIDDINNIKESYNISTQDAVSLLCDNNGIDDLAVSVSEGYAMIYPEIFYECNAVIAPVSEDAFETIYLDECLNYWLETGDETPLDEYTSLTEVLDYVRRFNVGDTDGNDVLKQHYQKRKQAIADIRAYERVSGNKLSPGEFRSAVRGAVDPETLVKTNKRLRNAAVKSGEYLTFKDGNLYNSKTKERVPGAYERNKSTDKGKPSGPSFLSNVGSRIKGYAGSGKNWVKNNKVKTGVGVGAAAGLGALAATGGVKKLTNKLSALKDRLRGAEQQYEMAPPEKKGFFKRIIDKIKSMISTIMNKIKSLGNKKVDISMSGVRYVD